MAVGRGRPSFIPDNIVIFKYTQTFEDEDKCKYIWVFDKDINSIGPLSVTFEDPTYNKSDKLLKELENIDKKYIPKKGDRKPRVTKEDKARITQIGIELDEFYYSFWPEDRKPVRKNAKNKKA